TPVANEPAEAPPPPRAEAEAPRRTSRRARKPARDQDESPAAPAEPTPPEAARSEPAAPSRSLDRASANPFDRPTAGFTRDASKESDRHTDERSDLKSSPNEGDGANSHERGANSHERGADSDERGAISDERGPRRRRRRGRRGNRRHDDEFRSDEAANPDPVREGSDGPEPTVARTDPRAQGRPDSPASVPPERPHHRGQDRGRGHGPGQQPSPHRGHDRHHDRGPRRDGRDARPFAEDDADDAPRSPLPIHRGGKPAPAIPVAAEKQRIGLLVDLSVLLNEARDQGGELVFRKLHSALAAGDDVVHAVCFVPPEVNDSGRRALHNSGFDIEPCDSPAAAREALMQTARSATWPVEVLVLAGAPTDVEVPAMNCRVEFAGFGGMAGSRTPGRDKERSLGKNCMFVP
ncbi:MAG: hypothetical protein ABL997_05220, partial [Planctomycetota bacterium]